MFLSVRLIPLGRVSLPQNDTFDFELRNIAVLFDFGETVFI